jgi:outer membrane protein TolC
VELASKNYNVTLSRYNNGLATITDMLDASNTKLNAEILLVDSKINLLYNYLKIIYLNSQL